MHLICGINPVLEALNAGNRTFDRLLVAKGVRNRRVSEAIARATQMGVPLRFEGRHTLDRMSNGLNHQGIIAVVSSKQVVDLDALLGSSRDPALLIVLDGIEDPRNLGAIVRTAEGVGADGIVVPERHSAPLSETVSRTSAGALEYVRVARVGNLSQAIQQMKDRGLWVVGFDASASDRWHAPDFKRPSALVFGGEGRGIRRLVRESCDQVVSLPLFGHVASLNVSVTVGAALYEVIRQRGYVPSHVRPIPSRSAARPKQIVGPAPDDAEDDPGRLDPHPEVDTTFFEDGDGDVEVMEGALLEERRAISVIDLHEDVGWSSRPVVSVLGKRARTRRHGAAGRNEKPRRKEARRAAAPEEASPDEGGGARRRKRRRRRPARREEGGSQAPKAADRGRDANARGKDGGESAPRSPDPSSEGDARPPAAARRRRRRRRSR